MLVRQAGPRPRVALSESEVTHNSKGSPMGIERTRAARPTAWRRPMTTEEHDENRQYCSENGHTLSGVQELSIAKRTPSRWDVQIAKITKMTIT